MNQEELPSVEIMRLQPGDVIVANFEHGDRETIRAALVTLQERFPGHEVLAVGRGVRLSVAREASA